MSAGRSYFVADLHLGPDSDPGRVREKAFVEFLRTLPPDAEALYLLGDIFDFWIDYRDVVPRGSVRVLAALADVAERMDVWFFRGNHDWWVTDYFEKELGVHIVREPLKEIEIGGQTICLGHGDTLGCHDAKSKLIFHIFRNKTCLAMLKSLPPRWVFWLARHWSAASRRRHPAPAPFAGREAPLYQFVNEYGRSHQVDLYLFGHWHAPACLPVESGGTLRILGAWKGPEDTFTL